MSCLSEPTQIIAYRDGILLKYFSVHTYAILLGNMVRKIREKVFTVDFSGVKVVKVENFAYDGHE